MPVGGIVVDRRGFSLESLGILDARAQGLLILCRLLARRLEVPSSPTSLGLGIRSCHNDLLGLVLS